MDLIYLDNSATSYPKPQIVYDYMTDFYKKQGVSPGRSGYDMCMITEEIIHNTRKMLTSFFNGTDPNRLTFNYNATDSLNIIINGLVEKGDHVISTNLEHNSVLRPLYHHEQDKTIEVTYLPFDERGYINPEDVKKTIRANTKMVVMNHGSNVIGTVQPAKEVGKICAEAGILFVLDASQTAGAVPVDVQAMQTSAIAFTGHKCLMGPTGIGGIYTSEGIEIKHTRYGGTGVRSAVRTHLDEYPYRLEAGTLNTLGVSGLNAGQRWLAKEGIENVHKQEMDLWDTLRQGLQNIEKVTTYCAQDRHDKIAVLSFTVEGWEALDVGTMLDVDYGIACRTGLQCAPLLHQQLGTDKLRGAIRFSVGPFNTEKDIIAALEAVEEIASLPR